MFKIWCLQIDSISVLFQAQAQSEVNTHCSNSGQVVHVVKANMSLHRFHQLGQIDSKITRRREAIIVNIPIFTPAAAQKI